MTTPENDRARARLTDPYTSHTAAAAATRSLPTHRALVLAILEEEGEPLTHPQIIAAAHRWRMQGRAPFFTEQSIRTRCNELERAGLVLIVPDESGLSPHGNPAQLHVARSVWDRHTTGTTEEVTR